MADITMCTQTLCPNAGHCYRAQAEASDWQSIATFNYTISTRGVECDNYMPMYRTGVTDSTVHNVEVTGGVAFADCKIYQDGGKVVSIQRTEARRLMTANA